MADAPKILGTSAPGPSLTTLYTCPSATSCVARLFICNQNAVGVTVRVALSPLGAAIGAAQYVYYDTYLSPNDTLEVSGLAFAATDLIRVYASTTNVSFVLDGIEAT